MTNDSFQLFDPEQLTTSVVFSSPHSGRVYTDAFVNASSLDRQDIRSSEDAFVDLLFDHAPQHGAPLLCARMPRAYLDLNRGPEELDPGLIQNLKHGSNNPRVTSGLGVIPRVVSNGRAIYQGKLSLAEARARIDRYWHPYHRQLQSLLDRSHRVFGQAILIDCHSMPHEAVEGSVTANEKRPDVVLGDRFGAAAGADVVECVTDALTANGLRVVRNRPFAGAYITQRYGRPSRQQHVVQIEIDRSLYLDEKNVVAGSNFAAFQNVIRAVTRDLAEIGRVDPKALAAE